MSGNQKQPNAWGKALNFADETYRFQFIRTAGAAYSGGADFLECLETAARFDNGNGEKWYTEWLETAERIRGIGDQCKREGHLYSAGEAYLRASNYYRNAEFFIHDDPKDERHLRCARLSRDCFVEAMKYSRFDAKTIEIPFEGTTLPGYYIRSPKAKGNAPLFITHTGFDGTAEEMYFFFGPMALDRGYHFLIFDGPGQGMGLREKGLYFRPNWETVMTPVVDFALTLPGVDKDRLVYCGISMAGYLAPRALAFEHRIKVGIAHGGMFSISGPMYESRGPDMVALSKKDPKQFNEMVKPLIDAVPKTKWYNDDGKWKYNVASFADIVNILEQYTMQDVVDKIKCPMLVTAGSADHLTGKQAKLLYDALTCPKTFIEFTADDTGETHCQCGAFAIGAQRVFDWLDGHI